MLVFSLRISNTHQNSKIQYHIQLGHQRNKIKLQYLKARGIAILMNIDFMVTKIL